MNIKLLYPYYLALLLVLPLLVWLFRTASANLPRWRKILLLSVRTLVILLLVLGVSGLSLSRSSRAVHVLFVLDLSASIDEQSRAQAMRYIRQSMQAMKPEDTAGLVVFGADPSLEVSPQPYWHLGDIRSTVNAEGTNIAKALRLALASFPGSGKRRIVLLTDGNETSGKATEAAVMAKSLGVEITVVPLSTLRKGNEVRLERIQVPEKVRQLERYEVKVVVWSRQKSEGKLVLLKNGYFLEEETVQLQPGKNRFTFLDVASEEGLQTYEAVINAAEDQIAENNRSAAFTEVLGRSKVLLVYQDRLESPQLVQALQTQGILVEARPWTELPDTLHGLLAYDAILFDNVSGLGLSLAKMELLERYVRDGGGGFLMLGGDQSFGAGGYYQTPVEALLPVNMDIPSRMTVPSLCMVLVIDKSDSMGGYVDEASRFASRDRVTTKLEVAKMASFAAIKLLNPFDRVGLLAFNTDYQWVVPITEAGKREEIAYKLSSLKPGGGTDLYKGLQEGFRELSQVRAMKKHLIALSDGLTQKMDFQSLIERIAQHKITVSTVALGEDADRKLMENIARWGGGRSYYTSDPMNVPRIFTTETVLVSRGLVEEREFRPQMAMKNSILRGFEEGDFPPLYGYVLAYAKPTAETLLVTDKGDPLLVAWRYGLGRAVAFTSDLKGRWGKSWLQWTEFPRLIGQLVRWTQRQSSPETVQPTFQIAEERGTITADVLNAQQEFLNYLHLQGTVVLPDRQREEITLSQIAPGRYQGTFSVPMRGEYYVTLFGEGPQGAIEPKTFGVAVPYSSEYLWLEPNYALLNKIAALTGGEVAALNAPRGKALFTATTEDLAAYREIWFPFVLAALLLFFFDIVLRKLVLPEQLTQRLRDWKSQRQVQPQPALSYEELNAMLQEQGKSRERRERAQRQMWERDPTNAARFYVARMKEGRR
ncbi:MAG: VWA domain-containing protein [Nitrospinota bacterium]|nr:MAG: VWA domain-containing protein [Nitrospinota bacterium]